MAQAVSVGQGMSTATRCDIGSRFQYDSLDFNSASGPVSTLQVVSMAHSQTPKAGGIVQGLRWQKNTIELIATQFPMGRASGTKNKCRSMLWGHCSRSPKVHAVCSDRESARHGFAMADICYVDVFFVER
jgi:hypothetical protein